MSTGPRLSLALLLYLLLLIALITLVPFRFELHPTERRIILSTLEGVDFLANVLLFLPLGYLYPLADPRRATPLRALVLGLAISTGIELAQLFESSRYSSVPDVLANGGGAWWGAVMQGRLMRRLRQSGRLVGQLSLELPLMGLVYLLVPLLWVGALGVQDQPLRLVALMALGTGGARLIATVQRHHFGPAGVLTPSGVAIISGGGMLLGVFPVLVSYPGWALAVSVAVALEGLREAARPVQSMERRFEAEGLRRAAPLLLAYAVLSVVLPLAYGAAPLRWILGFPHAQGALVTIEQVRWLESIAAMTVLGYAAAESQGRRERPFLATAPLLALACALAASLLEAGRGLQPAWDASVAQWVVLLGVGLFGGWVYDAQRAHVRALVAERNADWRLRVAGPTPRRPGMAERSHPRKRERAWKLVRDPVGSWRVRR